MLSLRLVLIDNSLNFLAINLSKAAKVFFVLTGQSVCLGSKTKLESGQLFLLMVLAGRSSVVVSLFEEREDYDFSSRDFLTLSELLLLIYSQPIFIKNVFNCKNAS